MTYSGRRVFTAPRWMLGLNGACAALFALGSWMTYRDRGWTWVSIGLAAATLVGIAGMIEVVMSRIELTDDALVVTDLAGRRRYPRNEVERVAEAKGSAPILVLRDGRKVKLSPLMPSLANSVRAWVRAAEIS